MSKATDNEYFSDTKETKICVSVHGQHACVALCISRSDPMTRTYVNLAGAHSYRRACNEKTADYGKTK